MIALVSDLHISDESTSNNPTSGAFNILFNEIEYTASKADEIHIVLLGDILDLVRTDYWNRNNIPVEGRPWNGVLDAKTAMNSNRAKISDQFMTILNNILKTSSCKYFIDRLNKLGSVYTKSDGREIPIRITYVIGNHDRVINNFKELRDKLQQVIPQLGFANYIIEPDYSFAARHGHEWDENCYGLDLYNKILRNSEDPQYRRFSPESYNVMAIGEVITAELMSGFLYRLSQKMQKMLYVQSEDKLFLQQLKELNNIRPIVAVYNWLAWFTKNKDRKYFTPIVQALDESISAVIDSELGKKWDDLIPFTIFNGDLTDYLGAGQKLLKLGSNDTITKIADYLMRHTKESNSDEEDEYLLGAAREWDEEEEWENKIRSQNIQYIVYGHTHHSKYKYFRANPEGLVRMYVNSGTYLPLIEPTMDKTGFAESYQLPIIFAYSRNETIRADMGNLPALDFWMGIRKQEIDHASRTEDLPLANILNKAEGGLAIDKV